MIDNERILKEVTGLTDLLENECARAARKCDLVFGQGEPWDWTKDDNAAVLNPAIKSWLEKSLKHISDTFVLLFNMIRKLGQSDAVAAADVAKQLCWQAIDASYWPATDRTRSGRFADWLDACSRRFAYRDLIDDEVRMITPGANSQGLRVADRLNIEFRSQIELRLQHLGRKTVSLAERKSDGAEKSRANGKIGPLPRYKSKLKQAVMIALRKDPDASDLLVCRSIDVDGSLELKGKDRLLADVYRDSECRPKLQTTISKVRSDLRKAGLL